MLVLDSHQQLLDDFLRQKNSSTLHHALIFRVNDDILLTKFISSLCSVISGKNIDDYNDSPYVTIANVDNDEIKVAEVKKIIKNCELTAHNDVAKIIIIEKLELMNESAANALLKTLEEPTKNTFFLMFSYNYARVLNTVKSRSLSYDISLTLEDKNRYLGYTFEMSSDAIKKSMQMSRNNIDVVAKIKLTSTFWQIRNSIFMTFGGQKNIRTLLKDANPNYADVLYWLTSFIIDCYFYKTMPETTNIANYDKISIIKYFATNFDNDYLYKLYKEALMSQEYFDKSKNIDRELILENLILKILK